jgi:membrane protein YdbS with pleckstrin-like domain
MRCSECNTKLQHNAEYCHRCGFPVDRRSARAPGSKARDRVKRREVPTEEAETLLWRGTFSAKGMIHSWLLAILISIVLPVGGVATQAGPTTWMVMAGLTALVWLGLAMLLIYQKLNVNYELTDQRLIHRSGILVRQTDRIELIDMDDVSHEQGLIERLFGVGTIEITSSDRTHPVVLLPGIDHVNGVAALIDDARRRERVRRGLHIEQI